MSLCLSVIEGTWEPATLSTMPAGKPVQKQMGVTLGDQPGGKGGLGMVPDMTENLEIGL